MLCECDGVFQVCDGDGEYVVCEVECDVEQQVDCQYVDDCCGEWYECGWFLFYY